MWLMVMAASFLGAWVAYLTYGFPDSGEPDTEVFKRSRLFIVGACLLASGLLWLIDGDLGAGMLAGAGLGLVVGHKQRQQPGTPTSNRAQAIPRAGGTAASGGRAYGPGVHHHAGTRSPPPEPRKPYVPGDGRSLELYVAGLLRELGWTANVTKKGADSGVDVVARKPGHLLVVQAKNMKQPAGRRAVQEVFAGWAEYDANEAWVVSTNGFTRQAKESAGKLGVKVLRVSTLEEQADAVARAAQERWREEERRQAQERQRQQEREAEAERARARAQAEAAEASRQREQAARRTEQELRERRARAERQAELDSAAGERLSAIRKERGS